MATFPILYSLYSEVLDAPTYLVVVSKAGSFKAYRAGDGRDVYDSSEEYGEKYRSVFDDPKRGVTRLPLSTRNPLQNNIVVSEGASEGQIKSAIDSLALITPEMIKNALDKLEKDE